MLLTTHTHCVMNFYGYIFTKQTKPSNMGLSFFYVWASVWEKSRPTPNSSGSAELAAFAACESKYAGDSLISSHRTSHQSVLIRGVGHIFRGKFTTIGGILWAGASELSYSATLRLNSQYRNSHVLVPQARYHQHAHRTDHPHTGKHNDKNIDSRGRCLRVVTPRRAFWNTNRTLSLLLQAEEILLTRSHTLVERLVLKGALCKEGRSFEVLVCVTLELTRSD